ncbi:MAG: hypothetical protein GXP25_09135 [Planctomycetes bacterium]|nr:hypothetical protein [Planctomycetota bacterium]
MKETCIVGMLSLVVLCAAGVAQPVAQKLTPEWTGLGGRWKTDGKRTLSGWGFLRYDEDLPDGFRLKGKLSIEKAGGGGAEGGTRFDICFRRNPNGERPTYLLRIKFDSIALIKWDEGRKTLDEVKIDVPQKKPIPFELRMKEGKIQAKVGNKIRLQAVDPKPIEHKKLLICSIGMRCKLKDLKLTPLK